jgi:hypothetical protein
VIRELVSNGSIQSMVPGAETSAALERERQASVGR